MSYVFSRHFPSPLGTLVAEASDRGLTRLCFARDDAPPEARTEHVEGTGRSPHSATLILDLTCTALKAYFSGQPGRMDDVPLDLALSAFQTTVLESVRGVPFGHVLTYGALARAVGSAGGARAVGSALASNPVMLVLPCHRIVPQSRGRGGGAGGYAGGSWRKEWLLQWEAQAYPC